MNDSVRKLGRLYINHLKVERKLTERDAFLQSQVKFRRASGEEQEEAEEGYQKKETYLVPLVFNLDSTRFEIPNPFNLLTKERCRDYLWVGRTPGSTREYKLTMDWPAYLVDNKIGAKWAIGNAITVCQIMLQNKTDHDLQTVKALLIELAEKFFNSPRNDLLNHVVDSVKSYDKKAAESLLQSTTPPEKPLPFIFTVAVKKNGKVVYLAKTSGYRKLLEACMLKLVHIQNGSFHERKLERGVCHVCGRLGDVTTDPAYPASLLKVYNIDKKGFTSNLEDSDEARARTHVVCLNCLPELHAGAVFVQNNLRIPRFPKQLNTYMLPKTSVDIPERLFEEWLKYSSGMFSTVVNPLNEDMYLLPEEQLRSLNVHDAAYCMDLIFGELVKSQFKVAYRIDGIPYTHLKELRKIGRALGIEVLKILGGKGEDWTPSFSSIERLVPLRKGERSVFLTLCSSLLRGDRFPAYNIVERGVLLARIHRHKTHALYDLPPPPKGNNPNMLMTKDMIRSNILLRFMEKTNALNNSEPLEPPGLRPSVIPILDDINLPEAMQDWFETVGYDDERKALFLLGALVAKVGTEQYLRGDEKKAILNKIDFYGMSVEKVMMLVNEVTKALRDYKIQGRNEKLYDHMMMLLDSVMAKLSTKRIENTFYILSGYSFVTYRTIMNKKEREDD